MSTCCKCCCLFELSCTPCTIPQLLTYWQYSLYSLGNAKTHLLFGQLVFRSLDYLQHAAACTLIDILHISTASVSVRLSVICIFIFLVPESIILGDRVSREQLFPQPVKILLCLKKGCSWTIPNPTSRSPNP